MRRVLFADGELCSWWLGWRRRSGFAIMEFNMIIAFREECLCLSVCYVVVVGKREREKEIPNATWSHVASSAWGVMLLLLLSTLGERHSVTSLGVT